MSLNNLIYLDNNATTKVDEKVVEAMLPYFSEEYGNPSSIYDLAHTANSAVRRSRETIKEFLGAKDSKEILFTSCGSESANTAIKGVLELNKTKKHIITSKVEHPCVLNLYKELEKHGYKVDYIGVDSSGDLDVQELAKKVGKDTALVSIMYANNETGAIFPVKEIADIVKDINPETKVFVDAVQAAGKIPVNVQETK